MNIPFIENGIKIKKWIPIPKINLDKKIRISLIIFVCIYMIINGYYGQASVHNQIECIDDLSHRYTKSINNYFLAHKNINFLIKFFFSF